jgi:hypothetical protein
MVPEIGLRVDRAGHGHDRVSRREGDRILDLSKEVDAVRARSTQRTGEPAAWTRVAGCSKLARAVQVPWPPAKRQLTIRLSVALMAIRRSTRAVHASEPAAAPTAAPEGGWAVRHAAMSHHAISRSSGRGLLWLTTVLVHGNPSVGQPPPERTMANWRPERLPLHRHVATTSVACAPLDQGDMRVGYSRSSSQRAPQREPGSVGSAITQTARRVANAGMATRSESSSLSTRR